MYAPWLIAAIKRFDRRLAEGSRDCVMLSASAFPFMKIAGLLLLVSGWLLVLLSIVLLHAEAGRAVFVLAGVGVQLLGLVLVFRTHRLPGEGRS